MAASLTEMYPKRKMDDITNCHKKAKMTNKPYYSPIQERSPSPSSPSGSSTSPKHHQRQKSVQFELSRNQHYEQSPLLTPKDEDYDSESDQNDVESHETDPSQLDSNIDYISLGSTVSVLNSTKETIERNISELSSLRAQAQNASKSDLVDFYVRLICEKTSLPTQHKIVKAPCINWGKYKEGMSTVSLRNDCTNNNTQSLFRGLNLFGSPSGN